MPYKDEQARKAYHAAYARAWLQRPGNKERVAKNRKKPERKAKERIAQSKWRKRQWRTNPEYRERQKANNRKAYRENPDRRERAIQASRKCYQELRADLHKMYGGECECCGEKETLFLQLDHVNGGGNRHYKQTPSSNVYRQLVKLGERSPDFRLLCANCNQGRYRNGGICPHKR